MFKSSFFRTNKESSISRQNDHAKFVGAFHLSKRISDENRAYFISIRFFKITDPFDGRSFLMCSQDPFCGTNKIGPLKTNRVNGTLKAKVFYLTSRIIGGGGGGTIKLRTVIAYYITSIIK